MNVPNVNGVEIKRDTWWVTRGGDKVRVICTDVPGDFPIVTANDDGFVTTHAANGCSLNDGEDDELDLIAPCVEPPKPLECWVNLWREGGWSPWSSESDAIAQSHLVGADFFDRIAVHMREVTP